MGGEKKPRGMFVPRATPGVQRPGQWAGKGDKCWTFTLNQWWIVCRWRPWAGLMTASLGRIGTPPGAGWFQFPNIWSQRMKRLSMSIPTGGALPPLPEDSVLFKKFPRFREFMATRVYDDGSPRKAGRLWMESDGTAFTATIFEQSAYARMRFRGQTLDDVMTLIEAFLGQESPQWEDDQYAREKAAQKSPKKKSA